MSVTANILQRTFHLRCGGRSGACFTVDVDNRRYLVTANHIAHSICGQGVVAVLHNARWKSVPVHLVGHGNGKVDVSVLAPQVLFGATHPLSINSIGLTLAEDVYFLGYPFNMGFYMGAQNAKFPLPLVKKGVVSALDMGNGLILLDGHNNPGFSGGPVVRSGIREGNKQVVIGVVSGYRRNRQSVLDNVGKKGPYTYDMNTGIVSVYDTRHVEKLIFDNPIGIKAS